MQFKIILLFTGLLMFQGLFSQDTIKSWEEVKKEPFSVLFKTTIEVSKVNKNLALEIASKTLEKANKEGSEIQKIYAYQFMAYASAEEDYMQYVRKVLVLGELPRDRKNLAAAYFLRARYKYNHKNFGDALEDFLIADKLISEKDSFELKNKLLRTLAIMRSRIGQYDKALEVYRKILSKQKKGGNFNKLGSTYHYMANTFIKKEDIDSATFYLDKWYSLDSRRKTSNHKKYIDLLQSIVYYKKQEYEKAIPLIEKTQGELVESNDLSNLIICYYILGKSNLSLGKMDTGIKALNQFDSIFRISKRLIPQVSDGWDPLIQHFSKTGDSEKQLYYMESLLLADSILASDYKELSEKITSKIDLSKLKEERDIIIQNAQQKETIRKRTILSLIILLVLAGFSLGRIVYLKRKNEKNYQQLLNKRQSSFKEKQLLKVSTDKTMDSDLSEELCFQLEQGLISFEKEGGFLEPGVTISKLAKEIGTNHKYLSKYINDFKGLSFPNYINGLRINYTLNKLDNDKLFHRWTISAISKEVGFSSSKYFTNAFKNITGIKPTYYIKEHFTHVNS